MTFDRDCPSCGATLGNDGICPSCSSLSRGFFRGFDLDAPQVAAAVARGLDFYRLLDVDQQAEASRSPGSIGDCGRSFPMTQHRWRQNRTASSNCFRSPVVS